MTHWRSLEKYAMCNDILASLELCAQVETARDSYVERLKIKKYNNMNNSYKYNNNKSLTLRESKIVIEMPDMLNGNQHKKATILLKFLAYILENDSHFQTQIACMRIIMILLRSWNCQAYYQSFSQSIYSSILEKTISDRREALHSLCVPVLHVLWQKV